MKALAINPMETPRTIEINNTLEDLQKAVGGMIQIVYPWEDLVAIVCNDEGKINGLPLNRILCTDNGRPYDVIVGNFLIVGIDEETDDFVDIPEDLAQKYMEIFKDPEIDLRVANLLFEQYEMW